VGSVDLLRGLTILVMLFVNDLASVGGTPGWLQHVHPPDADGMTLVDVVFPAFLFIVGLSLPLALERRLATTGPRSVVIHTCVRAASLLAIGVFMVNGEHLPADPPCYRVGWTLLVYLGVFLVWVVPRQAGPATRGTVIRRWVGIAILLGAALWFREPDPGSWLQFRPRWWGILGLIGWAYLVSAAIYLLLRRNLAAQVSAIGLLYCVYLADRAEFFEAFSTFDRLVDIGSMLGSLPAITLSGAVAGQLLLLSPERPRNARKIAAALGFGLILATAGMLLHALREIHPMFIINKIAATPPWCLLSSACTIWIWAGIHRVTDASGFGGRPRLLADAGRNALLAFIAGPIGYATVDLVAWLAGGWDFYAQLGNSFGTGLWRSLAFALGVTWLTGWLWRRGWTLKL
jgi:heparan-alpha-glucosaminide N-acetyltransferase